MNKSTSAALYTLVSVFFFWGFVAASNDILIPVFKEELQLEQWQSQMVSFAFYVAYTIGSLGYVLFSKLNRSDLLNRIGYKNGIALGLLISAAGTLLFYPAAEQASFSLMITGLFIVGLGFSLQQTVANPLIINLGDSSKGAQRLSLAGAVNNVGTTIGPLLISYAIFGNVGGAPASGIESVKVPYLILGGAFALMAVVFKFSGIPDRIEDTAETVADIPTSSSSGALAFKQLTLGMIAIFVYVGVEVSTASNLPEFMRQELQVETRSISPYISLYWGSLMIGRWAASVGAFQLNGTRRLLMRVVMPYLAFIFFLAVNRMAGNEMESFYVYAWVILFMIAADILSKDDPARQLFIYSLAGIIALFTGILTEGWTSVFALISVGLFCSTLWPCIFTLAIAGLGKHTNNGAGLLIMMIMGGGIISLLQGYLSADGLLGIRWSYLVGVACFLYLAWYAFKVRGVLKQQGVQFTQPAGGSH
jgi:FHS family L-fucose permease-like MFS transporter